MPKSNIQKLKEAIASGDLETAKKLTEKLAEKPKKPKKVPRKPKEASTRTHRPKHNGDQEDPSDEAVDAPVRDTGEWHNPSRVPARYEPISTGRRVNRINEFDKWQKKQGEMVEGRIGIADEILTKKAKLTPRPGMPGARRPPAKKIGVHCDGCGRPFKVYPSELMMLDAESVYKCDRCIVRGK